MKKADLMFYLAYIFLFILFGVWLLIWAVGMVPGFGEMLLFWLLSAGILATVFGTVKTRRKPKGEVHLMGFGLILSIITLILLGFAYNVLDVWMGVSVGIILVGIVGLIIFLSRIMGTIED